MNEKDIIKWRDEIWCKHATNIQQEGIDNFENPMLVLAARVALDKSLPPAGGAPAAEAEPEASAPPTGGKDEPMTAEACVIGWLVSAQGTYEISTMELALADGEYLLMVAPKPPGWVITVTK